ncbi:MAG: VanZ family protein [Akkermansiaceae bacterium]|nr:VanZ family protein [Akkermansiaceae bacterium]
MGERGFSAVFRQRALLALGGLMCLLLVPFPRPAEPEPILEDVRNLLHVPLFMAVMLLLRVLQRSVPPRWRSLWICAFAAALLGGLSEILQGLTGRTPSVGDFGADLAGILLACVVSLRGTGTRLVTLRRLLLLAGVGMFALAAAPLVREVSIFAGKHKVFPVLMDRGFPGALWQGQGGTRLHVVDTESGGLQVEMPHGDYEGLRYMFPRGVDTAGYSGLVFETANDGESFELGVRVDVTTGSRKNAAVLVPRGNAVLKIHWVPEAGDGGLKRVVLFTGVGQPARKFRLSGVRLLMEPQE